jgi:DNA gyrase subunit A
MAIVGEGAATLTVSESGLGRRTPYDEYRLQGRGGKGLRNYYCDKNGPVAGFCSVDDAHDIVLITDSGIIIRIPSDQISMQSRYAGGVRVMRVDEETKLIGITVVEKQEEDNSAPAEETEEAETESQEVSSEE